MLNKGHWSRGRILLISAASVLLVSQASAFLMTRLPLYVTQQRISEQQDLISRFGGQIRDVRSMMSQTQDIAQRQELILEIIDLEAQRLDAKIHRLDLQNYASFTRWQQIERISLVLLALFGIVCLTFIRGD